MNIEIANHLVQLRKKFGYSQETLAEKLGLSRQAVSKWERAEASPDTDNLIQLAKLYNMSLDELLLMSGEPEESNQPKEDGNKTSVDISFKGIHVIDGEEEVHVGLDGVHLKSAGDERVHEGHIFKRNEKKTMSRWLSVPFPIIITAAFLVIGFMTGSWHPAWMLFLLIPVYYTLIEAIINRAPHLFAFPVVAVIAFLCLGYFCNLWHPGWIVYLSIPVYYCIFPEKKRAGGKEKEEIL